MIQRLLVCCTMLCIVQYWCICKALCVMADETEYINEKKYTMLFYQRQGVRLRASRVSASHALLDKSPFSKYMLWAIPTTILMTF